MPVQLYTQLRFFLKATLNLHDISPRLANTKSSIISMPGLHDVRPTSYLYVRVS